MSSKPLPLLLIFLALTALPCRAQDLSGIPAPKTPLVTAVPDPADWTITLKRGSTATPSPPPGNNHANSLLLEVHSTHTGKYRRDVLSYSDGRKTTQWVIDQFIIWMTPEGQPSVIDLRTMEKSDPQEPDPSAPDGFPGMRWLQPSFYDRAVLIDKRPCYHFAHGTTEAWIEVETRLPALYKSGEILYQYKFGPAPAEPLVLPAEVQKVWDRLVQISRRKQLLEGGPVVHR